MTLTFVIVNAEDQFFYVNAKVTVDFYVLANVVPDAFADVNAYTHVDDNVDVNLEAGVVSRVNVDVDANVDDVSLVILTAPLYIPHTSGASNLIIICCCFLQKIEKQKQY